MSNGYRGSVNLKKAGVAIDWTPELLQDYIECSKDPIVFGERHMKIVSKDRGLITIPLYDYQKEIIDSVNGNRFTVAEMARQSGKTTAMTVYILWYIIFHQHKTVAILANKGETAREILSRIQLAYSHLPKHIQAGLVEWNKGSFELENGSKIFATSTSSNNVRGFSLNFCLIDEAAHIANWEEFSTSIFPTISSGETTKLVLVSTVNGLNHFYDITSGARQNRNDYKLISVSWEQVPGRDQKWKENTLRGMNNNIEKFQQEYENRYLGSSGTLISGYHLQRCRDSCIDAIISEENCKLYEQPIKDHIYTTVCDVSRGKGLDYSAFSVFDITESPFKQVFSFRDNYITPLDYAELIFRVSKQYNNSYALVEINDIGQQVADSLFNDFDYENILYTENRGRSGKYAALYSNGKTTCDRGIRTTKTVKSVGCTILKLLVEQEKLIINDKQTVEELCTFSRKNDSYCAEDGKHDDTCMVLVLFSWFSDQQLFTDISDISTLNLLKQKSNDENENNMINMFVDYGQTDEVVTEEQVFMNWLLAPEPLPENYSDIMNKYSEIFESK